LDRYGITELVTSHDHVLGIGSSIALNFQLKELHDNPSMVIHGFHVYDEKQMPDRKSLITMLAQYQEEPVSFLNDFDLPYVFVKTRYPRLRKKPKTKKRAKKRNPDDDEDGDEGS